MGNDKVKKIIRETIEDYNSISEKYSSVRGSPLERVRVFI
jgi:hypothetical protein